MSRNVTMDESNNENNQRQNTQQQPDLFRILMTDSKLVYLCNAIEQYELAQLQLRQNEDQQRQLRQYLEYNHLRMLELDLSRKRIMNSSSTLNSNHNSKFVGDSHYGDDANRESGPHDLGGAGGNPAVLLKPPEIVGTTTTQGLLKPISTVHNALPIQQSLSHPMNNAETEKSIYLQEPQDTAVTEICNPLQREKEPIVIELQLSPVPSSGIIMENDEGFPGEKEQEDDHPKHDLMLTTITTLGNTRDTMQNDSDLFTSIDIVNARRNWPEKEYTKNDVLCERGNFSYNHEGNKRYRAFVKSLQDQYIASKKIDKIVITTKVLDFVTKTMGGRFLGHDEQSGIGGWRELSEEEIRRKIGQSLREKNKRYVPAPRKRFLKDIVEGKRAADEMTLKEQGSPLQLPMTQESLHTSLEQNEIILVPPKPYLIQQQLSQQQQQQQQQLSQQHGPSPAQQWQQLQLSQQSDPMSSQQQNLSQLQHFRPHQQQQLFQHFGLSSAQQQHQFSQQFGPQSSQLQQLFRPSSAQQKHLSQQQPGLMKASHFKPPPPGFSFGQSSLLPSSTHNLNMGRPSSSVHGYITGQSPPPPWI